jgi:transposase InsO family protein
MLYDFVYLVAIMDWFSRYVLAWRFSPQMDDSLACRIFYLIDDICVCL